MTPVPPSQKSHFIVSRRPNPRFTGRKDELEKLHKALSPSTAKDKPNFKADIYVLYGMGGAGKSEVAVNFIYESRKKCNFRVLFHMLELKVCRFWGIFWINARSKASIATCFQNIAQHLDLDGSPESAVSWLQDTSQSWLLILDNADEPSLDLSPYLPAGVNGSILITSRLPDCARKYSNAGKDHYERLAEDTAVELLIKSSSLDAIPGSGYKEHACTIVDLLGCHALAIVQAGTAVSHGICKLEEYKSMFLNQRRALFESMQDQVNSEYGGVYTTFEISASYLEGRSDQVAKDALHLLNFHAFMHFSDFPEEAFLKAWKISKNKKIVRTAQRTSGEKDIRVLDPWYLSNLPTFMRQNLDGNELDIISLRNARNQLESLSLVSVDRSNFTTRLHPVTHAWSKDRLIGPKSEDAWLNALAILSLSCWKLKISQPLMQMLQPHIESMPKRPSFYDKYKAIFSIHQSFYQLARCLLSAKNPAVAHEILQLIPINADDARNGNLNFQQIQLLRAQCAIDLGDLKKAEELLKQALKSHGEVSKAEDEVQRGFVLTLARVYTRQERQAEATEILKPFFQVKMEISEVDPHFLEQLALVYFEMGDLLKAKSMMEQVVPMKQEKYKVDHDSRLNSEVGLAQIYEELGDTIEATKIYERVTQTLAKTLEPNNIIRLCIEYQLASCYYDLRRYKESLRLAESMQGFVRNVPGKPMADKNTNLIRRCLKAIELEKVSCRDESLQKSQSEVEMETKEDEV